MSAVDIVSDSSEGLSPKKALLPAIWQIVRDRGIGIGDQLPSIREFSDLLDVRPTTIRDAFLEAQAKGWIRILPRAGAFLQVLPDAAERSNKILISHLSASQVEDYQNLFHLMDARRVLELELIRRAAERRKLEDLFPVRQLLDVMLKFPADVPREEHVECDIQYHLAIAKLSGNPILVGILEHLFEQLRPHQNAMPKVLHRYHIVNQCHIEIFETLVKGDADKAEQAMYEHLSLSYDGLLRLMQEVPTPGDDGPSAVTTQTETTAGTS